MVASNKRKRGLSNAPVVIVVHGLRVSKYDPDMLTVAGMLHKTGFNVLLFDLRDHGKSTIEDGRVSIGTKEYRDVIASVDWLIEIQDIECKTNRYLWRLYGCCNCGYCLW